MRALILAPIAILLVVLVARVLAMFTGDPLSALMIELIGAITLVGAFTRDRSAAGGRRASIERY